jgi:hypothetical protein
MKVVKINESDDKKLAELIKEKDKHQAIVDELTKKIRKIVYNYGRN